MYFILFFINTLFFQIIKSFSEIIINNNLNITLNNILFDSIKVDPYDLSSIYQHNYSNIKIQRHKSNKNNSLVCVFGILVNDFGLKIEKEMLDWLSPEYEIYKVYQKFPGILYEYPSLKFAEWLTENKNISFLLYLHSKGATHKYLTGGEQKIRNFWKNEFTKPRNKLYISPIINNETDISTPLSDGAYTWYNGMFISKRAFRQNRVYLEINRYIYEKLFINNCTRIKGIIAEKVRKPWCYLDYFSIKNKNRYNISNNFKAPHKNIEYNNNILYFLLGFILVFFFKFFIRIYRH